MGARFMVTMTRALYNIEKGFRPLLSSLYSPLLSSPLLSSLSFRGNQNSLRLRSFCRDPTGRTPANCSSLSILSLKKFPTSITLGTQQLTVDWPPDCTLQLHSYSDLCFSFDKVSSDRPAIDRQYPRIATAHRPFQHYFAALHLATLGILA
ncbi:hypothetical protein VTL71DRAFT_14575 [Oculimacula yallundae]|uniref:Uncharacterized protein n=1 Tax=Oculimacula yallundae TaxID=86028 RepID=A0ABR4CIV5_9HELO